MNLPSLKFEISASQLVAIIGKGVSLLIQLIYDIRCAALGYPVSVLDSFSENTLLSCISPPDHTHSLDCLIGSLPNSSLPESFQFFIKSSSLASTFKFLFSRPWNESTGTSLVSGLNEENIDGENQSLQTWCPSASHSLTCFCRCARRKSPGHRRLSEFYLHRPMSSSLRPTAPLMVEQRWELGQKSNPHRHSEDYSTCAC